MDYEEHKPFRTIDEQINILKNHNLSIEDEEAARLLLKKNNYYRLSGYFIPHKESNEEKLFLPGIKASEFLPKQPKQFNKKRQKSRYIEVKEKKEPYEDRRTCAGFASRCSKSYFSFL